MKIQIISLTKQDYKKNKIGRWYFLPEEFVRQGHNVKYNLKKDWWRWYLDYLLFRPDVVITFGLIGGLVGIFKKLGLIRRPLVFDWNDYLTELSGKSKNPAFCAFLEYMAIGSADLVTSAGLFQISVARNLGQNAEFILHGVRKEMNSSSKTRLSNKLNLLYVGEQSIYKRVNDLVKSVKGLNCTLYLIGEVNQDVKNSAPDNAIFLGKLEPDEVSKYINSADVCIDTQDQDGSLKVVEYMFKGKPIIGIRGRKSYMFSHLKDIYLTDDFKEAISYFIENPGELKRISKNVKKHKILFWDQAARNYIGLVKKRFNL